MTESDDSELVARELAGGISALNTDSESHQRSVNDSASVSQGDDQTLVLPVDESVITSYDMSHGSRGRLLVISNDTFDAKLELSVRRGFDKDIQAIRDVFQHTLGFELTLKENLSHWEMFQAINKVCGEDHSDRDCLMIIILTHGKKGVIFATDSEISIESFFEPLKLCQSLTGKPKIIFIQACRGERRDTGITMYQDAASHGQSTPSVTIPVEADFLFAYSTADGYVSFNNPDKGSWFIQELCAEFKANWQSLEAMQLLTRVCQKLAFEHKSHKPSVPKLHGLKQVSSITTTLTKALYFPSR